VLTYFLHNLLNYHVGGWWFDEREVGGQRLWGGDQFDELVGVPACGEVVDVWLA
jgi:hypothetical protein